MALARLFGVFLAIAALAGCGSTGDGKSKREKPAPQGDRLTMGLSLPVGAVREVEYTAKTEVATRYQGQRIVSQSQAEFRLRFTCERVDRNRLTYLALEVLDYRADESVQVNGGERFQDAEVASHLAGLARALPGKRLGIALTQEGVLAGVDGLEAFQAALLHEVDQAAPSIFRQVPGEPLAWQARFASHLAPENLQGIVEAIFRTMPNRPLRNGDQWLIGPDNIWWGQMWQQGTFTLQGHGKGRAQAKLEGVVSSPRRASGPLRLTGSLAGTATFDTADGLATQQQRRMEATVHENLPFPPNQLLIERITRHDTIRVTGG